MDSAGRGGRRNGRLLVELALAFAMWGCSSSPERVDDGSACVALASVRDQCPADWGAAIADQIAFCAAEAPFFDTFLSSESCRGSLLYTRYLFDAGPRSCLYDPATWALAGYRAVDGKAGFEQTSCGSSPADFDHQGCAGTTCPQSGGEADGGPGGDGKADAPDAGADRPPSIDAATCSGICNAAVPTYPTVDATGGSGNVTMYTTEPSSGGACNYGVTGVVSFAAINVNVEPGDGQGQWQDGRACGQCLEVTTRTSQGGRSVVVRIMDRCADVYCGVDLGGDAPAAVMPDGFGRYDGTWRLVSCAGHPEASDGPPSLHVLAGSNAWWSRVQVRNPPWAVDSIAWRDPGGGAGGAFPYADDPENSFAVPSDVLQEAASSLVVTVRYGDGATATAEITPADLAAAGTSYPLE